MAGAGKSDVLPMPSTTPNTSTARPSIFGMSPAELVAMCEHIGVKPVHAERLSAHFFRRGNLDPDAIADLPESLRRHLRTDLDWPEARLVADQLADDGTRKLLLAMPDGREVETVLIPAAGRLTQCISTQVGCAVGCRFCLTATAGLTRNLTAAEMVLEIISAERIAGERPRNLVLMGMGEPLHNFEEVARFLAIVTDPKGMAFSPNRVTLSTAGLVPAIRRLLADDLPCNLAVSLNATTDAVRSSIMPINRKYPLAELLETIRDYVRIRGGKRVLIEYVMLAGINDSLADAERLCELLDGIDSTVNLLPFNEFSGNPYRRPSDEQVSAFRQVLVDHNLVAVVRESRGRDISAACGQLKTEVMQRRCA
jgi:23S rRNA (adenine2503-C2)-methyltransferase